MNIFWDFVFSLLGQQAKLRLLREAKKRGVLVYLRTVQGTRRLLMTLLMAFFVVQLMIFAFVGALVSGIYLMDLQPESRLQVIFTICSVLFALPLLAFIVVFSERLWYKASGAQDLVENLRADN